MSSDTRIKVRALTSMQVDCKYPGQGHLQTSLPVLLVRYYYEYKYLWDCIPHKIIFTWWVRKPLNQSN